MHLLLMRLLKLSFVFLKNKLYVKYVSSNTDNEHIRERDRETNKQLVHYYTKASTLPLLQSNKKIKTTRLDLDMCKCHKCHNG